MAISHVVTYAGFPDINLSGAGIQNDDLAILTIARTGPSGGYTVPGPLTSGYTQLFGGTIRSANGTLSVNLAHFYKFLTTADTLIDSNEIKTSSYGSIYRCAVFRGVDKANPFDISPVYSTGNSIAFNPVGVTPVTAGAVAYSICQFYYTSFTHSRIVWGSPYTTLGNFDSAIGGAATYSLDGRDAHTVSSPWSSGVIDATISNGNTGLWVIPTFVFRPIQAGGKAKVWSGSAWAAKPVKVWNGSSWVAKPVKRWNGSAWVTTSY